MRLAADDLDAIAGRLRRRESDRRLHLERTATRLRLAADLLTTEAAELNPRTVAWATKIGRTALAVGGGLVLGLVSGGAEGVGAELLDHALHGQRAAEECLLDVDGAAGIVAADIANDIDTALWHVSHEIEIAAHDLTAASGSGAPTRLLYRVPRAAGVGVMNRRELLDMFGRAVDELQRLAARGPRTGADERMVAAHERVNANLAALERQLTEVREATRLAELGVAPPS